MHPWNEPLFESLKRRGSRFPHALLIHGPRGTGKLALAERIAQFLLCEADAKPCGACQGCRWFLAGSHPDLRRVEPESLAREPPADAEEGEAPAAKKTKPSTEIKVEQVRELAGFLNVGSHRGGRRIALVHPAEDMNDNSANALLKGLEEPPAAAIFILVSHRPARLLPTIRSRCVALPVAIPPRDTALEWLSGQAPKPQRWLAYAGGAPLLALEYAGKAEIIERLLQRPTPVDDRDALDALAEALQKIAVDRALSAFGLAPKYQAGAGRADPSQALAWLTFARQMGEHRQLSRHPLNPKLFSAQMLAALPKT